MTTIHRELMHVLPCLRQASYPGPGGRPEPCERSVGRPSLLSSVVRKQCDRPSETTGSREPPFDHRLQRPIVPARPYSSAVDDHGWIAADSMAHGLDEAFDRCGVDDADADLRSKRGKQPVDPVRQRLEVLGEIIGQRTGSSLSAHALAQADFTECQLAMLAVIEGGRCVGDDLDRHRLHRCPRSAEDTPCMEARTLS